MNEARSHTVSGGNVFADLMIDEPDVALAKAALAQKVTQIIREKGWTQRRAAETLGIDQPKVSALMRGALSGFSIERLLRLLNLLEHDVAIVVTPKRQSRSISSVANHAHPDPAETAN